MVYMVPCLLSSTTYRMGFWICPYLFKVARPDGWNLKKELETMVNEKFKNPPLRAESKEPLTDLEPNSNRIHKKATIAQTTAMLSEERLLQGGLYPRHHLPRLLID